MDGRWMGAPLGPPRVSLQSKLQPPPPQPPKDRECPRDVKTSNSSTTSVPCPVSRGGGGPQGSGGGGGPPVCVPRGVQSMSLKRPMGVVANAGEPAVLTRRLHTHPTAGSPTPTNHTHHTNAHTNHHNTNPNNNNSNNNNNNSSHNNNSNRPTMLQQLPLQTEEELLKGCGFQAMWSENFEVSGLMNAAVKICRLAPTEGDEEWQEAQQSFYDLLNLCWARLGRHQCLLQSRLQDLEDVLLSEESIQTRIQQYKRGVKTAVRELYVAEEMQKRRREVDAMCGEVLKKPSLKETTRRIQSEEMRTLKTQSIKHDIMTLITHKKNIIHNAIRAAEDLFLPTQQE